ncbi:MAG: dienelactone hydrolase family protein [Candidatus Promineifilaceae bacterium]|nr:dienelactone hydrolase family protein [Candidatus Promineifilaceae bacterium]
MTDPNHPHGDQPVLAAGAAADAARAAMILVHGRGASARSILTLAQELDRPDFAYLAPQAARSTWYPYSFLAPVAQNEPYLSSALRRLGEVLGRVEAAGIPPERIMLLGFSQGACLASEFAARHPRRYGGIVALSGGLIGPPGIPFQHDGDFQGTPAFLGCSDVDPHIPEERVHETARILRDMNADVTARIYPGMGHTVNADELEAVRQMMDRLAEAAGEEADDE